MADSIEIRLDQLTDAIKGLYAKSSMSQGEIYNALTSLSQRYENLTNVSSEKIAQTLVGEFRKTIDIKYGQTNQFIKDLENSLRNFMANSSNQNPRMAAEISKLLTDTANTFAKLNSQDALLQKMFLSIEKSAANQDKGINQEILKLSENFTNFTHGFENITLTLNKNFAEFLNQVRQNSTKKEYELIKNDLVGIQGSVGAVVNSISMIDAKYRDLSSLITAMQNKEGLFNEALKEVKELCNTVASIKTSIDPTSEIQALGANIKNQIESIKYEIQKIVVPNNDIQIKTDLNSLVNNVQGVHSNLQNVNITIGALSNEIKDIHGAIIQQTSNNKTEIENFLNVAKDDMRNLLAGLNTFKKSVDEINTGNVKLLQEPLERALSELKSQDLGRNIQELAGGLRNISIDIQNSIQNIQMNLNTLNATPGFQILNQISETIPTITNRLEVFRSQIISESTSNLSQLKSSFLTSLEEFKNNISTAVERIEVDTRSLNIDSIDTLKIDLQKLSDHIVGSIELINEKTDREFDNLKTDFHEFANRQTDTVDKLAEKLAGVEISIENLTQDTIYKLNDRIDSGNAQNQDIISSIKNELIENISGIDKNNRETLINFETKIDKILNDNLQEKEILKEVVTDIGNKIECTNLQQIHNAKELLEVIQGANENLNTKLNSIEENSKLNDLVEDVARILSKLKEIESANIDISQNVQDTKEQIEQKLKDNMQKMAALVEKEENENYNNSPSIQDSVVSELTNKIQEYLSNFEYLKGNISQEVKEHLTSEFLRLDDSNAHTSKEIKENIDNVIRTFENTNSNVLNEIKESITGAVSSFENTNSSILNEIKNNLTGAVSSFENTNSGVCEEIRDNLADEFSKIETAIANFEHTNSGISKEVIETLSAEFAKLENSIKKIKSSDENSTYSYTLEDVESDLAKMRISIEKNAQSAEEFKILSEKLNELKTVSLENIKLSRDAEGGLSILEGCFKDTLNKLDEISDKVEQIQSTGFEDIKMRLAQGEKSKTSIVEFNAKIENALRVIVKNIQNQDNKIVELTKKADLISQTQQDSFNPAQFIDIFYENMTQTKMLSNRVEIIEDKINSIQNAVERLISYVEQ